MGKPSFDAPEGLKELLSLLERRKETFSVIDQDGNVYGWLVTDGHPSRVDAGKFVNVYGGDQLLFEADTIGEAKTFLYGCFLVLYSGRSMEQILEDTTDNLF